MDENVKGILENLASKDDAIRMSALQAILQLTDDRVDWAYEAWDRLLEKLNDGNSFQRSIGVMVLCNLAKSDDENRLGGDLPLLLAHTHDEKFITSRQCLQHIWKTALTHPANRKAVLDHLEQRFRECATENHYNLLRLDIIQSMRLIYDRVKDAAILSSAKELIQLETDGKMQKRYLAALKN